MAQPSENTVKSLARIFSGYVRHALTKEQLAEAVRLNAMEPEGSGVCHTHDFVDANEVMAEAMSAMYSEDTVEQVLLDSEHPNHQFMVDLWNMAWDRARENEFKR